MHLAQHTACNTTVMITEDDIDVHAAVDAAGCTCCPLGHHHGRAANETGTPCRPLTITLLAGSIPVSGA